MTSETSVVAWRSTIATERAALEREVEALHEATFAWALIACRRDRAEAEDVLQAAYLEIFDGRARFDGRSSVKTWLFAIVRRVAASRRRTAWLRRALLARWLVDERPPATPHEGVAAGQLGGRVTAAIATLAPRQREVIELVFYHDLTIEEAARVMGVGLGSARVHYDRGKRHLLAALATEAP